MKQKDLHSSEREIQIWIPALKGSIIGLFLLSLLFLIAGNPNSGTLHWMNLSSILVPIAGGIGGIFYAVVNALELRNGMHSILANFFSVLLYIFLLVLAFALGMDYVPV